MLPNAGQGKAVRERLGMPTLTVPSGFAFNINNIDAGPLFEGPVTVANDTQIRVAFDASNFVNLIGSFSYEVITHRLVSGTITQVREVVDGSLSYTLPGATYDAL